MASIVLVLIRPKGWPEAIWAVAGAALLIVCGLISPWDAAKAVGKGTDVYLFLTGMMIISELARRVGSQRMQKFLADIPYGNADISTGIDKFWLGTSLKISADEQVEFLRRLRA